MKIRNGFVSNSSSSSFVIAYKEKESPCPCCGREVTRIDHLVSTKDDKNRTTFNNPFIMELDCDINDLKDPNRKYQPPEGYLEQLEKAREIVSGWYDKYKDIVEVEISDYEDNMMAEILAQEKRGIIEILYWKDRNGDELRTKVYG